MVGGLDCISGLKLRGLRPEDGVGIRRMGKGSSLGDRSVRRNGDHKSPRGCWDKHPVDTSGDGAPPQ